MQKKLSVVTFNAFGTPFYGSKIRHHFLRTKISLRFRKIGQILNQSDADILCFQEVYSFRHVNRLKIQLTTYPYCVYKPYFISPRGGLVIFSKYPIDTWEYRDFSTKGKYWDKSITGKLTRRGMLQISLKDIPLTIINTHPVQNSSDNWEEENKYVKIIKTQLSEIREQCSTIKGKVILAGDFNINKNTPLYYYFMNDKHFQDAFSDHDTPTYIEEYLFGKKEAERNDYIFFCGDKITLQKIGYLLTEKEQLDNGIITYLSDHIALRADFVLQAPSPK